MDQIVKVTDVHTLDGWYVDPRVDTLTRKCLNHVIVQH